MSLISDTDYLTHSLRLLYLRDAQDPYGPRLITLDPAYNSNPYIIAASLADVDRWPEIAIPSSPQLSEDEGERPSGFPGARLKYTQTIMGGRTGGLGMRIHGKRASTSKRISGIPHPPLVKDFISEDPPVREAPTTIVAVSTSVAKSPPVDKNEVDSQLNVQVQEPITGDEPPVAKVLQFIPKFKGAAEMERRRRMRMAARRAPSLAAQPPSQNLDFSSSEEEIPLAVDSSSSSDFDDDGLGEAGSMDEGDEFDPEFAATRTALNSDSASDVLSVLSAGTGSIPNSSAPISASHTNGRSRSRLSPVSEGERPADSRSRPRMLDSLVGMSFEMITPAPNTRQEIRKLDGSSRTKYHHPSHATSPSISASSSDLSFARRKVTPFKPVKSSLSAMLACSDASSNPFAEIYAAISGRGESTATNVRVFFPHAKQPTGKAMDLNVRVDATVEEVIGFALWTYWKEGWLPKLDDGLNGETDPKWETKVSAVGWIMRIAEDDGEVDDDFPPPDRLGRISKFNADAYAVLEATPAQVQQNQLLELKIQRLPSRMTKKAEKLPVPGLLPIVSSSSGVFGFTLGSVPLSTSLGPSSSHGPQIFLRIRVDTADAVHISTTIPVSAGMYMQEALELVCRRRKISNPNDYALLLADKSILIPLDRTVASLQGNRELLLVKRSMLPGDILKGAVKSTDPNASIFKRMSDTPEVQYSSVADYTSGYKKYTIFRKAPMLLARQERVLAIDGVYIHIMPSANKAMKVVFDSGKTSSYHIKSIADCQQSAKTSSIFKIVLNRGAGNKRYDFEAESPRLAAEIVQTVKTLKASLDRSGTVNKSRRSRHVG